MRQLCLVLLLVSASCISLRAQGQALPQTAPPQTARQALLEMFTGKGADTFEKHLPEVTRHTLIRKGDTMAVSIMQKLASMGHELPGGGDAQTFDIGPLLIASGDKRRPRKD